MKDYLHTLCCGLLDGAPLLESTSTLVTVLCCIVKSKSGREVFMCDAPVKIEMTSFRPTSTGKKSANLEEELRCRNRSVHCE